MDDLNFDVKIGSEQGQTGISSAGPSKPKYETMVEEKGAGEEDLNKKKGDYDLSAAAHPIACVFTFLFKTLAVLIYFFGGLMFNSSILVFILVIILSALDFWTVKNVTGRLLVGLRWWSDYDEKGNEVWKFESYDKEFTANTVDTAFFWTSQIAFTCFWAVMFVIKALSLSFYWVLLVGICLALGFTNLLGYYKCRGDYSNKLKGMGDQLKQQGLMHLAKNMLGRS